MVGGLPGGPSLLPGLSFLLNGLNGGGGLLLVPLLGEPPLLVGLSPLPGLARELLVLMGLSLLACMSLLLRRAGEPTLSRCDSLLLSCTSFLLFRTGEPRLRRGESLLLSRQRSLSVTDKP